MAKNNDILKQFIEDALKNNEYKFKMRKKDEVYSLRFENPSKDSSWMLFIIPDVDDNRARLGLSFQLEIKLKNDEDTKKDFLKEINEVNSKVFMGKFFWDKSIARISFDVNVDFTYISLNSKNISNWK